MTKGPPELGGQVLVRDHPRQTQEHLSDVESTGSYPSLIVDTTAQRVVSHAGAVLLAATAGRIGLDRQLSTALRPWMRLRHPPTKAHVTAHHIISRRCPCETTSNGRARAQARAPVLAMRLSVVRGFARTQ